MSRHAASVVIPAEELVTALGLPPDTTVTHVEHDHAREVLVVHLANPAFPVVDPGSEAPRMALPPRVVPPAIAAARQEQT